MKEISKLLLFTCITLAFCEESCPQTCDGNSVQPVKIQYSDNGINLNIEIGSSTDTCESINPDPEFQSCESCVNVPYGRIGYKEDCSKFCECVQGKHARVGSCPEGLNFNVNRSVCDFKQNTNCSLGVSDNCQSCENIEFGFVPFENDCSRFCLCLEGQVTQIKQCAEGLTFNNLLQYCDQSSNGSCGKESSGSPEPTTIIPDETTLLPLDPNCNCGSSSLLVSYEGSCTKYCNCENRNVYECQEHFFFDSKNISCYRTDVECPYDVRTTQGLTLPTPKYPPSTTQGFTLPTPRHPRNKN